MAAALGALAGCAEAESADAGPLARLDARASSDATSVWNADAGHPDAPTGLDTGAGPDGDLSVDAGAETRIDAGLDAAVSIDAMGSDAGFAGSDGDTSNPSQLVDGGRFMQRVEVPRVSFDASAGVDGKVILAVMPRHFVLTHRAASAALRHDGHDASPRAR